MEEDDEEWYICKYCRKNFQGKQTLNEHKRQSHLHEITGGPGQQKRQLGSTAVQKSSQKRYKVDSAGSDLSSERSSVKIPIIQGTLSVRSTGTSSTSSVVQTFSRQVPTVKIPPHTKPTSGEIRSESGFAKENAEDHKGSSSEKVVSDASATVTADTSKSKESSSSVAAGQRGPEEETPKKPRTPEVEEISIVEEVFKNADGSVSSTGEGDLKPKAETVSRRVPMSLSKVLKTTPPEEREKKIEILEKNILDKINTLSTCEQQMNRHKRKLGQVLYYVKQIKQLGEEHHKEIEVHRHPQVQTSSRHVPSPVSSGSGQSTPANKDDITFQLPVESQPHESSRLLITGPIPVTAPRVQIHQQLPNPLNGSEAFAPPPQPSPVIAAPVTQRSVSAAPVVQSPTTTIPLVQAPASTAHAVQNSNVAIDLSQLPQHQIEANMSKQLQTLLANRSELEAYAVPLPAHLQYNNASSISSTILNASVDNRNRSILKETILGADINQLSSVQNSTLTASPAAQLQAPLFQRVARSASQQSAMQFPGSSNSLFQAVSLSSAATYSQLPQQSTNSATNLLLKDFLRQKKQSPPVLTHASVSQEDCMNLSKPTRGGRQNTARRGGRGRGSTRGRGQSRQIQQPPPAVIIASCPDTDEAFSNPISRTEFNCDACGTIFYDAKEMESHECVGHTPKISVSTPVTVGSIIDSYVEHYVQKTSTPKREFRCQSCNQDFDSELNYESHNDQVHRSHTKQTFCCEFCGVLFRCKSELLIHNISHKCEQECLQEKTSVKAVVEQQREFVCKVCDAAFGTSVALRRHESIHKSSGTIATPARYQCFICKETFHEGKQLDRHILNHEKAMQELKKKNHAASDSSSDPDIEIIEVVPPKKSDPPPASDQPSSHKCYICHESFNSLEEVNKHILSHVEESQQESRQNAPQPLVIKHTGGGLQTSKAPPKAPPGKQLGRGSFPCSLCNIGFPFERALALHQALTHGKQRRM